MKEEFTTSTEQTLKIYVFFKKKHKFNLQHEGFKSDTRNNITKVWRLLKEHAVLELRWHGYSRRRRRGPLQVALRSMHVGI